ncbi:tetratricopeptide repeat protein [Streptomyces sp. SDr-06]|uniref:tetratricopeptide repeat protein n=1 Tax=Streptomyces sp. SDr-06 TaxID=2267702 RepID=UPI00167A1E2B|nr:tetratricopeptide repeat protein [Streptomyces sp. SDr-06]
MEIAKTEQDADAARRAAWMSASAAAQRTSRRSGPPPVLKRAALVALAASVLVGGVLLLMPDAEGPQAPPPAPGPAARALTAVASGAPAAVGDLSALITDRTAWLRGHPTDEAQWAVLGSAYLERGVRGADSSYYPRAEWALRRSLQVRPKGGKESLDAEIGLAALANARHDYAAARTLAESVRARRADRWTLYPVLIEAYNGLGEAKAAAKAVEQVLELRGGPEALTQAAEVYRQHGWREDASAALDEAVGHATSPVQKAVALVAVGELAWERGEPEKAVAHYDAALRADPGAHAALAGRARAKAALGRRAEAQRDYLAAVAVLPRPEYLLELGELYEAQGLDGDARTWFDKLRELAARDGSNGVDDALVLGRFEADHGAAHTAVDRLEAEWKAHPSPAAEDALAWAMYRAGEPEEALAHARKASDSGMRDALFSYHQATIERDLGRSGAARRHYQEALRTNPYFSPVLAPRAKEALAALGEPADGGPRDMYGYVAAARAEAAAGSSSSNSGSGSSASSGSSSGSGSSSNSGSRRPAKPRPSKRRG